MQRCLQKTLRALITLGAITIFATGCREQIVHDLSEMEANRILSKLSSVSVEAEKVKQPDMRWTIEVDEDESLKAISFLSDNRILREDRSAIDERTSVISNRDDQRFVFERRLSNELERTISTVEGVLEARVHLNLPPIDPLFGESVGDHKGSASILVVVPDGTAVDSSSLSGIVAGAAGIPQDKISVLISHPSKQGLDASIPGAVVLNDHGVVSSVSWSTRAAHLLKKWTHSYVFLSSICIACLVGYGALLNRKRIRKLIAIRSE